MFIHLLNIFCVSSINDHCAVQLASEKMRIKLCWIVNTIISVNRLDLINCMIQRSIINTPHS